MPERINLWNMPAWAQPAVYIFHALCLAIFLLSFYRRIRIWWAVGRPELRFDHIPERLKRVLTYVLGQRRVLRDPIGGLSHASLFWGFVIFFIGTTLAFIDADVFRFLRGEIYLVYEFALDLFTLLALIGLGVLAWRRYGARPPKLSYGRRFDLALIWLLVLIATGWLLESFRMAVQRPPWGPASFMGWSLGQVWIAIGLGEDILRPLHQATWTFHAALAGLTYVFIPVGFLVHIVSSTLNVFFSRLDRPNGALAPIPDLETAERLGIGTLRDLTWVQLLNGEACTECGRCQAACPAYAAGTPLNPKQVVLDVRNTLHAVLPPTLNPFAPIQIQEDRLALAGAVTPKEAVWACTTCYACVSECPVLIEHVDLIVGMRRYLTLMEGDIPASLSNTFRNTERTGNPWGQRTSRLEWAKGLEVPVMAEKGEAEVLFWVGCAGAFDPNGQRTARAIVRLLQAAGVDFAVLGDEETCTAEWARRAGHEAMYVAATEAILETLRSYRFRTLLTMCPHCYNTFRNEYPQLGGRFEVVHHTEFLARLVEEGRLRMKREVAQRWTFHDSCYLGRYNGIFDAPRRLLQESGVELVEMARSRERGFCCGAGGAQVWMDTPQARPIHLQRLEEAMGVGPQGIAVACPFCHLMLTSAAQSKGVADQIPVRDVAEVMAEALVHPSV
ncbi:Lactate utilization protein A [Candidatus Thermoflexus japonica]|uniref:Lactate utilization protein A n=1 Tax=Candidatus Thermoflexus japonica TaxID=2035417 RepID=A0A2H5Y9P7_9CHLR|nr:Lactate utilization protein A [Candidatus Thermoflexus japonica]